MSEPLERAIERIMEDRSPLEELEHLGPEEREMLRVAQMLRGSRGGEIRADFVDHLHGRLFLQPVRISRRAAFIGGVGTLAAGLVAGLGLDRLVNHSSSPRRIVAKSAPGAPTQLVGSDGHWARVATLAEVRPGAVKAFTAGSLQGFLINDHGNFRAMSRICTHMGCALNFSRPDQALICPCHGAQFTLQGSQMELTYGGSAPYPLQLRPLPAIKVRTRGEHVEVWTI